MSNPALLVDCHVHVFDPTRFPYDPAATSRPAAGETGTAAQLIDVMNSHGVSHALVVTPTTGYAGDDAVTFDAVAAFPQRLRAIASLGAKSAAADIAAAARAGAAAVRFDLVAHGLAWFRETGRPLLAEMRKQGIVLDLQIAGDAAAAIEAEIAAHDAPVVIDHMGRPAPDAGAPDPGLDAPGFAALLRLAAHEHVHVKLSGPFRFSTQGYPYHDADPFARALLAAFGPERCVWGSDWPFVRMDRRLDYGPSLDALARWAPDPADRRKILGSTASRLFGLGAAAAG